MTDHDHTTDESTEAPAAVEPEVPEAAPVAEAVEVPVEDVPAAPEAEADGGAEVPAEVADEPEPVEVPAQYLPPEDPLAPQFTNWDPRSQE